MPAHTITRILHRRHVPALAACDPLTGQQIRASRMSPHRYEHREPGAMVHLDAKKLDRIPDGGGRRAHGHSEPVRGRGIGYDHLHTAIYDHSRLAYAEVLPDQKGTPRAAFLTWAAAYFAARGIPGIQRVLTDNAKNCRHSHAFRQACADPGPGARRPALDARQKVTWPRCPVDQRQGRTTQPHPTAECAHRRLCPSNVQRT